MTHARVSIAVRLSMLFYNSCSTMPGALTPPSMLFHKRGTFFPLVCSSKGFMEEFLLPSMGYRVRGAAHVISSHTSRCHLKMKASVERLQLCSYSLGHRAGFIFLIGAISGFPRFFVGFVFVFFAEPLCPFTSRTTQQVQEQVRQLLLQHVNFQSLKVKYWLQ